MSPFAPRLVAAAFFARVVVHASIADPASPNLGARSLAAAAEDLELDCYAPSDLHEADVAREVEVRVNAVFRDWDGTAEDLVARAAAEACDLMETAT